MFISTVAHQQPLKIISLVPSLTELVCNLGLQDAIVGITKFCVHPNHLKQQKVIVGGTKNVHIATVQSLHPTLILASKEENVKEQVQELAKNYPVFLTDIVDIATAEEAILQIAKLLGVAQQGEVLVQQIQQQFFTFLQQKLEPIAVAYLIWKNPYMAAGGDTFISQMLAAAGFENIFEKLLRYPTITDEFLKAANPQAIFLSSEPYPFQEKHINALQHILPATKILLVDGEMFSWYGSRMLHFPKYALQLREKFFPLA
jgi:ABC-type Fe3+-hydroxamate transport system substrate-binding protein